MKICPRCSTNKTENKYCDSCYSQIIELGIVESYELIKCDLCKSMTINGKFYKNIEQDLFENLLFNHIKFDRNFNLDFENISFEYQNYDQKEIDFDVEHIRFVYLRGDIKFNLSQFDNSDGIIYFPLKVKFRLLHNKCKFCQRLDSNYFEGTMQVRVNKKEFVDEDDMLKFLAYVRDLCHKYEENITKDSLVDNGFDLIVLNKKKLPEMVSYVLKNIVGESKSSTTLFSRDNQHNKNVYRDTYLAKLRNLKVGDLVYYDNAVSKIVKIKPREILAESLMDGKNTNITKVLDEVKKVQSIDIMDLDVMNDYPNIQVIDPQDYQLKDLVNKSEIIKNKVKVVRVNEKLFGV